MFTVMFGSSQDSQSPLWLLLPLLPRSPLSLYLHIPFCGTRCTYCAFNTYTNVEDLIPAYVEAMSVELRELGSRTHQPLHTIYFGGGTASLLSPAPIHQIIRPSREPLEVLPSP